ncbi:hypothetical protein N4T77_11270 [Clostridium sp. CX1]|uniref:Bypass of forespore C C-terminal domain-containing protein n=1 Tax=Clostridium tanneri TaxID=3037988 RepID=A0ABU4JPN9_9CLOT|nr:MULTISPECIES: hypothetical protein [unclassified Clostridium]MCT8977182.1 hypothetical protein [Clostridium sp. CX1]MDW8799926.1 hypothetical protein [Clostridium sp. A1-XYC3]
MDKRKIRTVLLVFLTITIFGLSYYICISKLKNTNLKKDRYQVENNKGRDALTVNSSAEGIISTGSNVIFKTKYAKSNEIIIDKEEKARDISAKNKSQIEETYKDEGYKVQSMTPSEVIMMREVDKYAPNKYVLGIKDQCIAIYKTDKDGNMFIENDKRDITDIRIDKLKQADIQLLTRGDNYFQCDTREEAESRLEDYE